MPKPTPKGCSDTPVEKKKKQDNECDQVITVPQLTGTCWFTSLLMSVFFSQYSRNMLLNKIDKENTDMTNELKAVLWDIMQRRHKSVYEMKDYAYMFFKVITPESILKRLYQYNSKVFNFNPDERSGYFNYTYLPKLLRFMGAKDLLLLDLDKWQPILTHSVVDKGLKITTIKKNQYRLEVNKYKVDTTLLDEYDYVIIYATDMPKGSEIYDDNFKIAETFEHRNKTYLLDSMLLTNFNSTVCKKGHDISGITCQEDRYVYNGWVRSTIDPSIPHDVPALRTLPCELMKYDWSQDIGDFCINPSACGLDTMKDKEGLKKQICFNFHKGDRVYIYVNKDRAARSQTPKSPKTPADFRYEEILEVMKNKTSNGIKVCPPGTVLNPKTNRCNKIKPAKECPPGTILNEKTKRCNKIKATKNVKKTDTAAAAEDTKMVKEKKKVVHKKQKQPPTSNDKLFFYSKSKHVAPGKGANEEVEDATIYAELAKVKDWRRVLSNFHVCPFKYDGYTYNTIEHAFQAKKIALVNPQKALKFTVESGDALGQGDGDAARKNRKAEVLDAKTLTTWNAMKDKVMYDASVAKYNACSESAAVLLATQNAQLWHIVSRSKDHDHFTHLEAIRHELGQKKNLKK